MGPAKIVSGEYGGIPNVRQREILFERGGNRANPVRRNLIVRERLAGLRVGDCGKSSKIAIPHRLGRNSRKIEGAQRDQLLIPRHVEERMVLPDGTTQLSLPVMLNVAGPFERRVRLGIQTSVKVLVIDHAMELVRATFGSQVVRYYARAVSRRVDRRHCGFLKEFAGVDLFARTIVAHAVCLEGLLR